jgi:hypothetical protein
VRIPGSGAVVVKVIPSMFYYGRDQRGSSYGNPDH